MFFFAWERRHHWTQQSFSQFLGFPTHQWLRSSPFILEKRRSGFPQPLTSSSRSSSVQVAPSVKEGAAAQPDHRLRPWWKGKQKLSSASLVHAMVLPVANPHDSLRLCFLFGGRSSTSHLSILPSQYSGAWHVAASPQAICGMCTGPLTCLCVPELCVLSHAAPWL